MGQAKLRGTFEQRAAEAQKRADEERAERDRKEAEEAAAAAADRIAAMTPEQRKRHKERKHRTHLANAMVMGTLIGALLDMEKPRRRHG